MNNKNDNIVKEFKELLLEKEADLESTAFFQPEKSAAEKFLNKLNYDEFFYVLNAWNIGREILNTPKGFKERLASYETKGRLFNDDLEELKRGFRHRSEAEWYFMEKKEFLIKESLDHYFFIFTSFED